MQLTLRDAARQVGASKSALLRAVKAGRLSATRDDDGSFRVDPAELHRAYPPERLVPRSALQAAAGNGAGHGAGGASLDAVETRVRLASIETENRALREMLEAEKRRADEIRQDRDQWRGQAERLLLAAPLVTPAPAPVAPAPRRNAWWRWWGQRAG